MSWQNTQSFSSILLVYGNMLFSLQPARWTNQSRVAPTQASKHCLTFTLINRLRQRHFTRVKKSL